MLTREEMAIPPASNNCHCITRNPRMCVGAVSLSRIGTNAAFPAIPMPRRHRQMSNSHHRWIAAEAMTVTKLTTPAKNMALDLPSRVYSLRGSVIRRLVADPTRKGAPVIAPSRQAFVLRGIA